MSKKFSLARRRTLIRSAVALAGTALGAALSRTGRARARELPHLQPSDPTAKQLMYVEDATQAPAARIGNAFCHNCQYYKGAEGAPWGPCQIFAGKAVNANGWCTVWMMRQE